MKGESHDICVTYSSRHNMEKAGDWDRPVRSYFCSSPNVSIVIIDSDGDKKQDSAFGTIENHDRKISDPILTASVHHYKDVLPSDY